MAHDTDNASLSETDGSDLLSQSANQNDDNSQSESSDSSDEETNVEIGVDVIFDENDENNNNNNTVNNPSSDKNSVHSVNLKDYPTNNPIFLALIVIFTVIIMPFRRHE